MLAGEVRRGELKEDDRGKGRSRVERGGEGRGSDF